MCGNTSESHNYQPIALATIISKPFKSVLLLKCEEHLWTNSYQFDRRKITVLTYASMQILWYCK